MKNQKTRKRKPNMKSKCGERDREYERSTNDPSWYASDPAILRDAASIPYSWSLGTTINRGGEGEFTMSNNNAIPGILRMDLKPTMGLSITSDSALNVAATAMYSFVRHANSGHANYDAPDLMIYCGAMAQVYSFINWCQRIYGAATMYAQKNRYIPRHLLTSMDIDPDSIIDNLANFRYWINVMVAKASSLAVPSNMSYFSRTAFLYSNIYCESDQIKDQLYYFHPAAWYVYQFNSGTNAGKLVSKSIRATASTGLLKLAEIQRFGEEMIGVILQDEDMNIMSGDILKAYGVDNIIKLTSIPEYLPIYPVYDPLVLEQFHNATCFAINDVDVVQDPDKGYLICTPSIPADAGTRILALTANKILSCEKAEPGPEDTIESTRLMLAGDSSRSTSTIWYVGCGTEVAEKATFYWINGDGVLENSAAWTVETDVAYNKGFIARNFKYAPTIYFVNVDTKKVVAVAESIDNYAVLSPQDIYKMHDVALMNMFAVPSVAKVNRM